MRPKTEWVEVVFSTLTTLNKTHPKRLWADVEAFLQKVCNHTKTHIHAVRGYELTNNSYDRILSIGELTENSHEHIILLVPKDEIEDFKRKVSTFKPGKAWKWIHSFDVFDETKKEKAYNYVLVKHEPVQPHSSKEYFCPRKYHRCRKGRCSHIPAP